ncbi:MAG: AAA family ATPase [Legionellaceae bacterium]|nr:AAA family ATPase [Legionellaceae bacterium]
MTTIYYWNGASGDNDMLTQYQTAITRLLQGDYASADLEKLKGRIDSSPIIYSLRLSGKVRILFTTRIMHGKPYLHILECLDTHDYQKSRFLKKSVLKNYLKNLEEPEGIGSSISTWFESANDMDDRPTFEKNSEKSQTYIPLDCFSQQFVQLSSDQQETLNKPLPVIINGVAGSGKTYIALSLLRQFITNNRHSDEPKRILYVTQELRLIDKMMKAWETFYIPNPNSDEQDLVQVDFLTYNELFAQLLEKPHPMTELPQENNPLFHDWVNQLKSHDLDPTPSLLFQEFRICSGLSEEDYIALGEHQSACTTEQQRRHVYHRYLAYNEYLGDDKVDSMFYSLSAEEIQPNRYQFIVVDEAQSLSLVQQKNLDQLADNHAIAYCIDPLQNMIDQCPSRILLETYFWDLGIKDIVSTIRQNYRCSSRVALVANAILSAQQQVTGKIDKKEAGSLFIDETAAAPGATFLSDRKNIEQYRREMTEGFAVITQPEFIEEACQLFRTGLVLTPEQIQGQEYHTVVIYHLLSGQESTDVLRTISEKLKAADYKKPEANRPKKGQNNYQTLSPWFHRLFTAYTRSQNTLIICEERNRNPSLNLLLDQIRDSITATSVVDDTISASSRVVDWNKEISKQLEYGNRDTAYRIAEYQGISKETVDSLQTTPIRNRPIRDHSKRSNYPSTTSSALKPVHVTETLQTSDNQLEAITIFHSFHQKGYISSLFTNEDNKLIRCLFETEIRIAPEGDLHPLFYHLIHSEDHLKRLCLFFRLNNSNISIENDFIQKVMAFDEIDRLPQALKASLCYLIVIKKLNIDLSSLINNSTWLCNVLKDKTVATELFDFLRTNKEVITLFNACSVTNPPLINPRMLGNIISRGNNKMNVLSHLIDTVVQISSIFNNGMPNFFGNNFFGKLSRSDRAESKRVMSFYQIVVDTISIEQWGPILALNDDSAPTNLFYFVGTTTGRTIWSKLLSDYPDVINASTPEAWSAALTRQLNDNEDRSVLFVLTKTIEGRKILHDGFLMKYPHILKAIPCAAWQKHSKGIDKQMSPLRFLSNSSEGLEIIQFLIENECIPEIPSQTSTRRMK